MPELNIPPSTSRSVASGVVADAIYGLRLLRANPGYSAMTILTIALGVGAVTTLFSVAYGVLLRPLPWADTDRLVRVMETRGGREGRVPGTILNGTFLSWAENPQTIEGIGAYRNTPMTLTGLGDAIRLPVTWVTPSMLPLLNVRPIVGRLFAADEGRVGGPQSAILSEGLWEQSFGSDPNVIGRALMLDGTPHTIVGVLPRDFRFPSGETRAWAVWQMPTVDGPNGVKRGTIVPALARLKPGVAPEQAAAEGTARALTAADPGLRMSRPALRCRLLRRAVLSRSRFRRD